MGRDGARGSNCRRIEPSLGVVDRPAQYREGHYAVMPERLAEICIVAGCPPGGIVLDPFGGAGTTGLVADRLQRDAILIELNPEYADMADRRIHGPLFAAGAN
jgi:DNA modification methylase